MAVKNLPAGIRRRSEREFALIDCDTHNAPMPSDLMPYLPLRWRKYVDMMGLRTQGEDGHLTHPRYFAARTDAIPPSGKPPGNDPHFFREQLLDRWDVEIAVLNPMTMSIQGYVGGNQPAELSAALLRASNDWVIEKWLEFDSRFVASICAPFEEPDLAIAEIERLGGDPRFVQILLPFRTQRPLGNRKYWPLFAAAVENDLAIALHPGGTGMNMYTGAGWPSSYFEDHAGFPLPAHAQMISLICEGVFEAFPALKIVIVEGGWAWVAPLCWRFDRAWMQLRDEVPHVTKPPSEYVRSHFWFTTQPMEDPEKPAHVGQALQHFGMVDRLLFSSDYPHWDFDAPDQSIPRSLDADLRRAIFSETARKLYGFSSPRS